MEVTHIGSRFTAFIRPNDGANVGLIHTPKGMILIDTTSSPSGVKALFEALGARPEEVRLVINTHFHNDHTWGNQLFDCPILSHSTCQELMKSSLKDDWNQEQLQASLVDLERSDPHKAEDFRQVLKELHIKLPDTTFDDQFMAELGGVSYEVRHMGGHTPDSSIIWLPSGRILYASDLIFQGRYPYIFDADIPAWISALDHLLEFEAKTIIPGHGILCSTADIETMRHYLQDTWEQAREHIRLGHGVEEACGDPTFPVFPGEKYERLHQANIRYIYNQLLQ